MKKIGESVLAILLLIAVWHILSLGINKAFLPTPFSAIQAFIDLLVEGDMQEAFAISAMRILVSGLLALVTALPLGIIMARVPWVDRYVSPLVAVLYPLPKVVFLPILVVFFGLEIGRAHV